MQGHVHAVGVDSVVREWRTVGEPVPAVEAPGRREEVFGARFEREGLVAAESGVVHDAREQKRGDSSSAGVNGCTPGLDLALAGRQLLQRATSQKRSVFT